MADGAGLADVATIGATPGSGDGTIPPTPGRQIEIKADATRQYVAGGVSSWYNNFARGLPLAIDDITESFGHDLYSRMLYDAQVRAAVTVFKSSILEEGPSLTPAVDDKDEDGYDQAVELHDRAERILDEIDVHAVLWDLLDAVAVGHRIAEQIYELETTPSGRREYTLAQLAPRPADCVAFVVDAFMNIIGILGRVPGEPFGIQQGVLLSDLANTVNLLPRSKFAVLTFRPKDNNPLGTSILRAAYDPWNQKQQLKREFLKYLTQFATPSLLGYTAPEARPKPLIQNGVVVTDTDGNPVMRSPQQDMADVLEAFQNGSYAAFVAGSKVDIVEMAGEGAPFLNAFRLLNQEIVKAVLNQTLATEEGEHQARAASQTHKDVLDTIISQEKYPVARMLRRDVLGTWLRLNGDEKLMALLPKVSLGITEQEDRASLWTATAALYKSGYLHDSQLPEFDDVIGVPERDPASILSIEEERQRALEQQQAQQQQPPANPQPADQTPPANNPPQPGQPPVNQPAQPQQGE